MAHSGRSCHMRRWIHVGVVPIVAIGASIVFRGQTQTPRRHPGTVLDTLTKNPVTSGFVRAYRTSANRKVESGCAVFDGEIQSTEPRAGKFELEIPPELTNYVAVYCMPGYYSREELVNANSPDLLPVSGEQIELLPMSATSAQVGLVIEVQIRRLADTLAYFERSNANVYGDAVAQRSTSIRDFDLKGTLSLMLKARTLERLPR